MRERLRRVLALRERRLVVGVLPRLLVAAAIERPRRTLVARVFVAFCPHVPVAVRAELARVADEHRRRLLVVLELPEQPVRRDVRVFAAAGVIDGRRVAGAVAGPVERRHVLEQLECRERRGREEVAFGAVDQQHGTVDLLQRVPVRLRPRGLHAGVEDADGLHPRVRAQRDGEKSSARLPHDGDVLQIDFALERRAVPRVFLLRPRDRVAQIVGVLLPRRGARLRHVADHQETVRGDRREEARVARAVDGAAAVAPRPSPAACPCRGNCRDPPGGRRRGRASPRRAPTRLCTAPGSLSARLRAGTSS